VLSDFRIVKELYLDTKTGPVISLPDISHPFEGVPGDPNYAGNDPVLKGHAKKFREYWGESSLHDKIRLVLENKVSYFS
jgi:hypothetical protein